MRADVDKLLRTVEAARSEHGIGNEGPEIQRELLSMVALATRRSHLERLTAGLPGADAVVERTHELLSLGDAWPGEVDDDQLIALGRNAIAEMASRAAEQGPGFDPTDAELFARLASLPVVAESAASAASASNVEPLTETDLERIDEADFESRIQRGNVDPAWSWIATAFDDIAGHEVRVTRWLLAPVTPEAPTSDPDIALWRAGATLHVRSDRVELVRGEATEIASGIYVGDGPSTDSSSDESVDGTDALAAWRGANESAMGRVLEIAADARRDGNPRPTLRLDGLDLASLPPLSDSLDWQIVTVSSNPGIDLSHLPRFANVARLSVSDVGLPAVPTSVLALTNLVWLDLSNNPLTELPDTIEQLASLMELDVSNVGLSEFPVPVLALTELKSLNVSKNGIAEIPAAISNLTALQHLQLAKNRLGGLPSEIGWLPDLRSLNLWGNPLRSLPASILELPDSCRLRLAMTELPKDVQRAKTVGALREVWQP